MQYRKKWLFVGLLLALAAAIKWYSSGAQRVEAGYSASFYPWLARVLRFLLGWLPFSIGDLLYGLFGLWILVKLIKGIKLVYHRKATWKGSGIKCVKAGVLMMVVYIVFNVFWGINYNRQGIAHQLGLKMEKYSIDELKNMNALLLAKANTAKQEMLQAGTGYSSSGELFKKVQQQYEKIDSAYPFLHYQSRSIKPSLWGWLGNYVGFLGYYNPFTGEAQVNVTVPKFLQPYTVCHEVAHQLGYAKENEANFVGYLAASASGDKQFQYSVYLDLFLYSNRNLAGSDTASAGMYAKQLLPEIKSDLKEWRAFNRRHKNPVEPVIRWMYGKYLQSNEQPQGMLSYDEVTSFLIAYYKRFGRI
jgi:Protein of unknown function (DUF3810)